VTEPALREPQTGYPEVLEKPGHSVARGELACRALWAAVAVVELSLLVRVLVMWAVGVRASLSGLSGSSGPVTLLYAITGVLTDRFDTAVNFNVPIPGLSHALDTPALLAMNTLFFATLALTKLVLWYARQRATAGDPVVVALARLRATVATLAKTGPVPRPRRRR
jgi:hypothetical protein